MRPSAASSLRAQRTLNLHLRHAPRRDVGGHRRGQRQDEDGLRGRREVERVEEPGTRRPTERASAHPAAMPARAPSPAGLRAEAIMARTRFAGGAPRASRMLISRRRRRSPSTRSRR